MHLRTTKSHIPAELIEGHDERPARLLSKPEVLLRLGVGNDTLYRLIKNKELGAPVKIGTASRWPSGEIDAFIEHRIAQRAAPVEPVGLRTWRTGRKAQSKANAGVA